MQKNWPFFLIVISIFFIEISSELTTTGMFMDGLIYDNLAANMSKGIGNFWYPVLLPSLGKPFVGHPPLAFGLLALCYKVFGIHIGVVKGYSLFMTLLSGLLMLRLWERVGFKRQMGWLPFLLWVMVPMVSQYACDNMLEGSMGVFVIAAVLCMLHFQDSQFKRIGWHLLAGLFLYLAFLTKGPTGLYPLCLPIIIWLVDRILYRENKHYNLLQALGYCLVPLVTLILCGLIVGLIQPAAFDYLKAYLAEQVVGGVSTITVKSRWYIVVKLFERTAIIWALALIILGIMLLRKRNTEETLIPLEHRKVFFIFFLLTLSGVIPMMISTKQRDFYILTVIPFLAIAIGALLNDTVEKWLKHGGKKFRTITTIVAILLALLAITLNIANWGKPGRDKEQQHDIELISKYVSDGEIIAVPQYINEEYSFINYAYRANRLELIGADLDCLSTPLPQHIITRNDDLVPDSLYRLVDIPTSQFQLYELAK